MKKKMWIGVVALLLVAVVAATFFFAIFPKMQQKKKMEEMGKQGREQQSTVTLEKQTLVNSISATGTIESAKSKEVSANGNGMEVKKVYVSVGTTVKKGAKLVVFDTTDLEEELADAKENLSDTTEEANEAISDAKEAVAEAKTAYNKAKQAKPKNEQEIEQKKEAYKQAKSQLENAQDNKVKLVKEANKKIDEVEKSISKCVVTAPMAGLVTALNVEQGDTYAGGAIAKIEDVSGYVISTTIDEYDISKVQVGQRVVVLTETTGEEELEGKVSFVSLTKGSANMNGMNSGSDGYTVEITLNSTDERLRLDLTAKCSIVLEEAKDVFAVPYDAVREKADGSKAIRVQSETDGDGEKEIAVTVGLETDYYVEISGEELQEGMKVLMDTDEVDVSSEEKEEELSLPGMGGDFGGDRGDRENGGGFQGGPGNGGGMPSMPGQ